jgi:hypothetical protein
MKHLKADYWKHCFALLIAASFPFYARGGSSLADSYKVFSETISSMRVEANSTALTDLAEDQASSSQNSFTTTLKYLSDGPKYYWAVEYANAKGEKELDVVYAFNKESYFVFLKDLLILEISSNKLFQKSATLGNFNAIFRPFTFLTCLNDSGFNMNYVLNREIFQNHQAWKKVEEKIVEQKGAEGNFVSLVIQDSKPSGKFFVVTFDKSRSWLPVNWKLYWDNLKRTEYQVLETEKKAIGKNKEIDWPVRAVEWIYSTKGDIGTETRHNITKLELNTEIEPQSFEIDPTLATKVYDVDKNVFIPIVK